MAYDLTFQAHVYPVLKEAFETYLSSVFSGRLYDVVGPSTPTFPFGVYQSQDGGGLRADKIGQNGWEGMITFRSLSSDSDEAWDNILALTQRFVGLTASGVAGYSIGLTPEHPQPFPIEKTTEYGTIYTAGLIVSFSVYKI